MPPRRLWVKRPSASPTLIHIHPDHLVDDVRSLILHKYPNALARLDAPDMTLHLVPRAPGPARLLAPDEPICPALDAAFPDGQAAADALLIHVPAPARPDPPPDYLASDFPVHPPPDDRPRETGNDYFPPMPVAPAPAPLPPAAAAAPTMSVLPTVSAPAIAPTQPPAPVAPPAVPTHLLRTSARPRINSTASAHPPTPPLAHHPPTPPLAHPLTPPLAPPLPAPRRRKPRPTPPAPRRALDASVPPINVLIVEDNSINLRILEGLMKRLQVRFQSAINGQVAVDKWRAGGFHLVLMDIQMPVKNGLQATREIRRLESDAGVGVRGARRQSPVIIVALTASSLQSDRHEALAAGCNDFLTKPVNFVWLERKMKEWGCMQALIDWQGWRSWSGYADGGDKEEEGRGGDKGGK